MSKKNVKIAVAGSAGRMGKMLVNVIDKHPNCSLVAATCHPKEIEIIGADAGIISGIDKANVVISSDPRQLLNGDVIIDFTSPPALFTFTESAVANNTSLIVGTTGLEEKHFKLLEQAGKSVKVFYAPNMSFGVNSFFNLARKAASQLKSFDIEIIESHHRHKKDAPSGTAIKLGEEIAEELGYSNENFNFDRQQKSEERKSKEIGFSSIRGGNIPGEHTVIFHGDNESIELTHKSYNRKIFSDGAIEAANWLVSQKNGLYTFRDMIT